MEEVWNLPRALDGFSFAGSTDGAIAAMVAPGRPRDAMWESYLRHLRALLDEFADPAPFPGAAALLDALEGHHVRLGLLTGNLRAGAEMKLRAAGLWGRFDLAISAFAEDGDARESLAAAARARCGEVPITIVGDSLADISCARHIGARVLAVATGPQPLDLLAQANPDRLEPRLSDSAELLGWLLS